MKRTKQHGFTLIELMVVVLIIMLISAMAMPSLTRAIGTIRLRAGVSSIAGMVQKARIESVRSNRIMVLRTEMMSDKITPMFYVDGAADPSKKVQDPKTQNNKFDKWEPLVTINRDITLEAAANAPAFDTKALLGYDIAASSLPFEIAFNQRGLPCSIDVVSGGMVSACSLAGISTKTTSSSAYQYFFHYKSSFGDQWASLTVTPAGRVRVWTWNGKDWS